MATKKWIRHPMKKNEAEKHSHLVWSDGHAYMLAEPVDISEHLQHGWERVADADAPRQEDPPADKKPTKGNVSKTKSDVDKLPGQVAVPGVEKQ